MIHAEDHVLGAAVLPLLAVHPQPQAEALWVGDLVAGHQPRAERVERLAVLALVPLPTAFELELALGNVVADRVARYATRRVGRRLEVARLLTDDDRELDLPVGLRRAARDQYLVVRADDGVRRLQEQDRFGRELRFGLRGVVPVIQPDAHDLAETGDGRTVPFQPLDARQ